MRALINGRQEEGQRLGEELKASGAAGPLVPFLHYTFSLAIRQASGSSYTRSWVVQIVADLRAGIDGTPIVVDPVAAESEILRAFGDQSVPVFPDGDVRATAQATLLWYAVFGMKLDDDEITELLAEARTMTDRDLAARASRGLTPDTNEPAKQANC